MADRDEYEYIRLAEENERLRAENDRFRKLMGAAMIDLIAAKAYGKTVADIRAALAGREGEKVKKYTLTGAQSFGHVPEHPERTARRAAGPPSGMNFDMIYQVWPSRAAMLTTIRMQERRAPYWSDWTACKIPVIDRAALNANFEAVLTGKA